MTEKPYPDISPAAWTVLLHGPAGQPVTADMATAIVGPEHAAEAVAELDAKHLIDAECFTPLAETVRRWSRA